MAQKVSHHPVMERQKIFAILQRTRLHLVSYFFKKYQFRNATLKHLNFAGIQLKQIKD